MHYIMLTLAHIQPFYALDRVHVEPESKVTALSRWSWIDALIALRFLYDLSL
jgi:hypothetical protein